MLTFVRTRRLWLAAGLCVSVAAGAMAGPTDAERSGAIKALLTVQKANLASCLVDPRDQKLGEALGMIPARLRELPGEAPNAQAQAIELALSAVKLLSRPGRLAVVYDAGYPAGGFLGYGIVASVRLEGEADARAIDEQIKGVLAQANLPAPPEDSLRFDGFKEVQLPPAGMVAFGARRADDGWCFEIVAGSVDSLGPVMAVFPAMRSEGMDPVMLATFDLSALTPMATFAQQMAGNNPQATNVIRAMTDAGLVGPDAARGRFEVGYTKAESVTRVTIENAKQHAQAWSLPTAALTPADLAPVPADATLASVSKADLGALKRVMDEAAKAGADVEGALGHIKAETGVDLRADVIDAVGGTAILYTSETTGGGGPGSVVVLLSLKDRARFLAAHDKVVERARRHLAEEAGPQGKYVSIRSWDEGGVRMNRVSARGVPVPVELSYAVTDKWLIAGLLPQSVMAAVRQATAGNAGLAESPLIKGAWRADRPVTSIAAVNLRGFMRSGYPLASMLGSAISRGVSSPTGERDPGLIVTPYLDLVRDARPLVQVTYWKGDAYVAELTCERSVVACASAVLGVAAEVGPFLAAAAAGQKQEVEEHHGLRLDEGRAWRLGVLRGLEPRWLMLSPMRLAALGRQWAPAAADRVRQFVPVLPVADQR